MKSVSRAPAITVVMAAYNAEIYIKRAIQSVVSQSFSNWELICIDDGSTDDTKSIVMNFIEQDPRIRLISQLNSGPASARQKGYQNGNGSFYIILDSDDWLDPNALINLYREALSTHADAVVVSLMLYNTKSQNWYSFNEINGFGVHTSLTGREAFLHTFPWKFSGVVLWKAAVVYACGFDDSDAFNKFNADEYITRKLFLCSKTVLIGSGQYYRYHNNESLTRKSSPLQFLTLQTDRKITDLAITLHLTKNELSRILQSQQNGIICYLTLFAANGSSGNELYIFKEILLSIGHCFWKISHYVSSKSGLWFVFLICQALLRGLAIRGFSVIRTCKSIKYTL